MSTSGPGASTTAQPAIPAGAKSSLLLVRMAGRACAIACGDIVEIVPRVNIEKVPSAGQGVLGVINLRGRVVPVLDVRPRFAQVAEMPAFQHLVILHTAGRQLGVAVDEVRDVITVALDAVERPGALTGSRAPGVVRIQDELVLVL